MDVQYKYGIIMQYSTAQYSSSTVYCSSIVQYTSTVHSTAQ